MADQYWIVMEMGLVEVRGVDVPVFWESGPFDSLSEAADMIARNHDFHQEGIERAVESGLRIVERVAP